MKIINLREYYPFYNADVFLEVSDEVASILEDDKRRQINYEQYIRDNKAFYSLERSKNEAKIADLQARNKQIDEQIMEQKKHGHHRPCPGHGYDPGSACRPVSEHESYRKGYCT